MPRWRFGLRWRLALGFAVILALALGSVAVFTGLAAQREVASVQAEQDRVRAGRIVVALAEFYATNGNWEGVQRFVNRISFQTEREIIVLDTEGRVVADSGFHNGRRRGHDGHDREFYDHDDDPEDDVPPQYFAPIMVDGTQIGLVAMAVRGRGGFVRPPYSGSNAEPPPDAEPPLSRLVDAVGQALKIAGVAAGVAGILLVIFMSRRMLASIGSLTTAARELGAGNLSSRAVVRGNDEVAELGLAFNNMADALEESERQRQSLVSNVAHELRTPLFNIQGHIEAMQDGLLDPNADNLETVHLQALHLNRLVDDLRLLAQSEAQGLRLDLSPASVGEIVQRVTASFRTRAEAEEVRLEAAIEEALPTVVVDGVRIEQVMSNLVDNAIRHTPPGGRVVVAASRGADSVRLEVTDTGEGIPAEALPRVFDRLYRVDLSRDRETGGSGLGLTISRQLVEAHGGTIWAESQEGSGSSFGFDLPLGEH